MDPLPIDLQDVSFSRAGAYLCITGRNERQAREQPHLHVRPGLWLRNLHDEGRRDVFFLEPLRDGEPVSPTTTLTPGELTLGDGAGGRVRFCLAGDETLRIRCEGLGLRLAMHANLSAGELELGDGAWRINAGGALRDYTIARLSGSLVVERRALEAGNQVVVAVAADGGQAGECALIQSKGQPALPRRWPDYEAEREGAEAAFERFRRPYTRVPADLEPAADLAAYISWSAIAAPCGHVRRPAMLMSKNWMANVWSWDHCFTAMGLAEVDPEAAWDQFMVIFDHQLPSGQLPDMINDTVRQYNFVKPPIHGWAYRWMMEKSPWFAEPERLYTAYDALARWTEWWFAHRDPKGLGLPRYHHGNDSGWDNGTVFDVGQPTEGPDLASFLVLQMDVLAEIAERLGRSAAAEDWRRRAEATTRAMLDRLWVGDRFVTRHAETGAYNERARSIINAMPVVIADRLPEEARASVVERIRENLTDWGVATEHPASELYRSDGYWRGPIWASPTLLLIDALRRAGEGDLAETIADRFRALALQSGFAENYDATTGAPLRDRSYTWASSVFLILAREKRADA